jgi:hypothetical protein
MSNWHDSCQRLNISHELREDKHVWLHQCSNEEWSKLNETVFKIFAAGMFEKRARSLEQRRAFLAPNLSLWWRFPFLDLWRSMSIFLSLFITAEDRKKPFVIIMTRVMWIVRRFNFVNSIPVYVTFGPFVVTFLAFFVTFCVTVDVAMKLNMFFQHKPFGCPKHAKWAGVSPNLDVGSENNLVKNNCWLNIKVLTIDYTAFCLIWHAHNLASSNSKVWF